MAYEAISDPDPNESGTERTDIEVEDSRTLDLGDDSFVALAEEQTHADSRDEEMVPIEVAVVGVRQANAAITVRAEEGVDGGNGGHRPQRQ